MTAVAGRAGDDTDSVVALFVLVVSVVVISAVP